MFVIEIDENSEGRFRAVMLALLRLIATFVPAFAIAYVLVDEHRWPVSVFNAGALWLLGLFFWGSFVYKVLLPQRKPPPSYGYTRRR